jgi:hypothetical protein
VPDLGPWLAARHARELSERAVQYVVHGWPVAALAVPRDGRCPCELGNCHEPHLRDGATITSVDEVAATWTDHRWEIAVVTATFDVVDLPPALGAPLHHQLKTSCPTAMAPVGRRWHFYLVTGSIQAEVVASAGGRLHSGPEGWVPAPGTRTEDTGRIRWLVPPYQTSWKPHRRTDAFDRVLRTERQPY